MVDAELALQGPAAAPIVTGTVNVKSASWARGFGASGGLFSGLTGGDGGRAVGRGTGRGRVERALRRAADRAVDAADRQRSGARRRQRRSDDARHARSAAAVRPRGDRARRSRVRGPALSRDARQPGFRRTPTRIQPFFDIEAETRVRVPGQTYRVTMRMAGTTERLQPQFTSDPPLQTLDILTLLFSDQAPSGDIELAAAAAARTSASSGWSKRARRARSPARCRRKSAASSSRPSASTRSRSRRCCRIRISSRRA